MRRKAFELAAHMREVNVDGMLRRIPYRLFVEWMGWLQLNGPVGDERADWRMATLCALLANIHRDRQTRWKPFEAREFLMQFGLPDAPVRRQTGKEQFENWLLILGDHQKVMEQVRKAKAARGTVPPLQRQPRTQKRRRP